MSKITFLLILCSILGFAQPLRGYWHETVDRGFGNPENYYVWSAAVFDDSLLMGTMNPLEGAEIWRSTDGAHFQAVATRGLDEISNVGFRSMFVFNGQLYIGAMNLAAGCGLYRTSDGVHWQLVIERGFGNPETSSIREMSQFNGSLVVPTSSFSGGGAVWVSPDGEEWARMSQPGFGDRNNISLSVTQTFLGKLFVGTWNIVTGCQVWMTDDLQNWHRIIDDGFGNSTNQAAWSIAVFRQQLYIGTMNWTTGCEIWRSSNGLDWMPVITGGFGAADNTYAWYMTTFRDRLLVGTLNIPDGFELWTTSDGERWELSAGNGLGDADNYGARTLVPFRDKLYLGTANPSTGAQVWWYNSTIAVPGDERTIQSAINHAEAGDLVLVAPGTYREQLDFAGKRIVVQSSSGPQQTIIDGGGSGPVVQFESGETRSTVLAGFTIQNGDNDQNGGGIAIDGASPTLEYNLIMSNAAQTGGGIAVMQGSPRLAHNIITANRSDRGGGLSVAGDSSPEIFANLINNNQAVDSGGGMDLDSSAPVVAEFNTIVQNQAEIGSGIYLARGALELQANIIALDLGGAGCCQEPGTAAVTSGYNDVWGHAGGDFCSAWQPGASDFSLDPLFVAGPNGNYYLSQTAAGQSATSPCVDRGPTPAAAIGLESYTTRTDELADAGIADIGFHAVSALIPTPTPPPDPSASPQPTPTYTPLPPTHPPDGLAIELSLNQTQFRAGDRFLLSTLISRSGAATTVDEYIVLDAFGAYFFWPQWTQTNAFMHVTAPFDSANFETILDFQWPSGAGAANILTFWAALVAPGTTELQCDPVSVSFGYE